MLNTALKSGERNERDDFCDIKIWSAECEHSTYAYIGDKFLCDVCETIPGLNHEVRPATMPYVSGDYRTLS
jgi:hypothetical protein